MPFLESTNGAGAVVIAGMGGFGLEVADYLGSEVRHGGLPIAGVLADEENASHLAAIGLPYLGTITDFKAANGEVVVVAVGSTAGRRSILARLWHNGVQTPAFAHHNAVISPHARIARGTIICPFSIVNRNATLREGSMLNVHCSIGHDASVGAYSVLAPFSALNGHAHVGDDCFLGTRATIYPRIAIGHGCIVDTHTGVRTSAGDNMLISSRGAYTVNAIRGRR